MLSKEEILRILEENKEQIKGFGAKRIGIFGSFVRHAEKDESDIDILVEFERESFDNYMELKFFLEDLLDRKVDLVIRDALKPALKPHVEREVVYAQGL